MKTRRNILIRLTLLFIGIGVVLSSIPFISSLKPNAKAEAKLLRVDVSTITPGSYTIMKHPFYAGDSGGSNWFVFVYRKHNGEFNAWSVPVTTMGEVVMPDIHWWRPFHKCTNFGPTLINGVVDENKPITCHDKDLPSRWWKDAWKWDINGSSMSKNATDMIKSNLYFDGETIVIGKRS